MFKDVTFTGYFGGKLAKCQLDYAINDVAALSKILKKLRSENNSEWEESFEEKNDRSLNEIFASKRPAASAGSESVILKTFFLTFF